MRWRRLRRSGNVIDRRGRGPRMAAGGGLGVLVIAVIFLIMGGDPRALLQLVDATGGGAAVSADYGAAPAADSAGDDQADFVSAILASTEDVWSELFARAGRRYEVPRLELFTGQTRSACGFASSAVGPFYCPGDAQVYLDLSFFADLDRRFGAPGDFAQAYVIAHEVGHHVQNLLGATARVDAQRGRLSEADYNALSVRLELQADFYAGVWAHHAQRQKQLLEPGDVEEGLAAAFAIGDDRLQLQGQGYVVPDSFTHGTSEQRVRWFRLGLESGDVSRGDTFGVAEP